MNEDVIVGIFVICLTLLTLGLVIWHGVSNFVQKPAFIEHSCKDKYSVGRWCQPVYEKVPGAHPFSCNPFGCSFDY